MAFKTNRPRILRYRWWVVARSRHGPRAMFLFLVVAVLVAVAFMRRAAAREEELPLNDGMGSASSA